MVFSIHVIFLLALVAGGDAYVLARRVEQQIEHRDAYQGGYALGNPASCPANYSVACGSTTDVNQVCCPTGNTCFAHGPGICCPTSQDCDVYVTTFPACADPTANMYTSPLGNFCCAQGLTGVVPSVGFPFCETSDVSVPVSLLATMVSQHGGTSVTPFGGFATTPAVTGSAIHTNAGAVTPTAGAVTPTAASNATPTSSSASPTKSSTPSSSTFGLSTPALVGLAIAALVVLGMAITVWRWCKGKVRTSVQNRDRSRRAGPSMMPAYIPTNVEIYEPAPTRPYDHNGYDPVPERRIAGSPMSPPPMSPSPAYSAVDQHEMPEGRGMYDPIETHGHGSGRVEMA